MNDTNIIAMPPACTFRPEQALQSALRFGDGLTDVLIAGYADGELVVRSSHMTRAEALWLCEKLRNWIMSP